MSNWGLEFSPRPEHPNACHHRNSSSHGTHSVLSQPGLSPLCSPTALISDCLPGGPACPNMLTSDTRMLRLQDDARQRYKQSGYSVRVQAQVHLARSEAQRAIRRTIGSTPQRESRCFGPQHDDVNHIRGGQDALSPGQQGPTYRRPLATSTTLIYSCFTPPASQQNDWTSKGHETDRSASHRSGRRAARCCE